MLEWLQPILVALGIAFGLFPIFLLVIRRRPAVDALDDDAPAQPLYGDFTEPLAAQIPISRTGQDELHKLLQGAGFYHRTALAEYRAVRTSMTLAPMFLTGAAALLVEPQYLRITLILGLMATLLGYSLPRVWLTLRRRARAREISRGLPLVIDLLTLSLTAGQNVLQAFFQVARELKFSHPVLSQELAITARQAELHSLQVAVRQWAERVQVPEVNNLALLLVQSEKLGTDTAGTLVELANNFRTTSRQRAEAQANRTSFWMLFPSVFCFWAAAAIILIGPAYLEFFEYRQRIGPQIINAIGPGLERANRRPGVPQPVDPNNPIQVPGTTAP